MKPRCCAAPFRARLRTALRNIAKRSCSITTAKKCCRNSELRLVSAIERSPAHTGAGGRIMRSLTEKLAATFLMASALAMPAYAAPPAKAGAGRSFSRAGGVGHSFTAHAARSASPRVSGRSANFATVRRGTSTNRSVLRSQRLTNGNTVNSNLRTNTLTNSNALTRAQSRALSSNAGTFSRRNATGSVAPLAARQGRFASRFAARGRNLGANMAARTAWGHHWRAGFVGWYGPVFWPYAYSDIFDYAFWPGGYEDGYWDYAYDNFFDGMFWGEGGPPSDYAYEPSASSRTSRVSYAAVQQLCTQPGTGITAWPFADIEKKVGLNDDQKALLGDVQKAAADAAATFKASCPAQA